MFDDQFLIKKILPPTFMIIIKKTKEYKKIYKAIFVNCKSFLLIILKYSNSDKFMKLSMELFFANQISIIGKVALKLENLTHFSQLVLLAKVLR